MVIEGKMVMVEVVGMMVGKVVIMMVEGIGNVLVEMTMLLVLSNNGPLSVENINIDEDNGYKSGDDES